MVDGNLLEIYYDRIATSTEVVLTEENCEEYGYLSTKATINKVEYTVFYKQGNEESEYEIPVIEDGVATTTIIYHTYQRYSHVAPACSSFKVSFADVDKEGSGRNSITGEMMRERIGSYMKLDLTWDLIPSTKEYNNWYRILTKLPPTFYCKLLLPSGDIQEKEFYRGDVSTNLYLFTKDRQIWKGLSTTMTQVNIDEYDDTLEPELL